jgi:hypothetical protein
MSKIKYYSLIDMARELNILPETVRKRMKRIGIKYHKRIDNIHYFSQKDFDKIKTKIKTPINKELFYPVYITTTYHIYQSKMNYEPNL